MQIEISGVRCLNSHQDIDMGWGIIWSAWCRGCQGQISGKRIEPDRTLRYSGWQPIGKYLYCGYCLEKKIDKDQLEFDFIY